MRSRKLSALKASASLGEKCRAGHSRDLGEANGNYGETAERRTKRVLNDGPR
jgi:hypothetical protein